MESRNLNVLITSFGGLGLPPTLNLVCARTLQLRELQQQIRGRLPSLGSRITITTVSNKEIPSSTASLSTLLANEHQQFLQLRLSVPLCGGKGGFGSQLRAAGGRMSSKRKKNQGENNNSNRNLDGRRLRTVNETKALAEYLALKPDMDKKEKEARKKRWEQVLKRAEEREEEIRNDNKSKIDGKWVEDKEEAGERTREAVVAAMREDGYHHNLQAPITLRTSETMKSSRESSEVGKQILTRDSGLATVLGPSVSAQHSYAGFDEDDEFMSASEDEEVEREDEVVGNHNGKGGT